MGTVYNYEILATRLRELAFLNKGIRLTLTDLRENSIDDDNNGNGNGNSEDTNNTNKTEVFYSELGLLEFVQYLDGTREKLTDKPSYRDWETDRKSTRLNSSHRSLSRMPSSA